MIDGVISEMMFVGVTMLFVDGSGLKTFSRYAQIQLPSLRCYEPTVLFVCVMATHFRLVYICLI